MSLLLLLLGLICAAGGDQNSDESVSRAHGELLACGMRDPDRTVKVLTGVIQAYDDALSTVPTSRRHQPRDQLAQLRDAVEKDLLSVQLRDSEALRAAIAGYEQVGSTAITRGVRRAALLRLAELYSFFGNAAGAAAALQSWITRPAQAAGNVPDDANDTQTLTALSKLQLELAQHPEVHGTTSAQSHLLAARRALERVLSIDRANIVALVQMAYTLARPPSTCIDEVPDYTAAVALLERAKALAEAEQQQHGQGQSRRRPSALRDPRFWQELGHAYAQLGDSAGLDATYTQAAAMGAFPSRWQRPMHYLPGLRARPVWNVEHDGGLGAVEAAGHGAGAGAGAGAGEAAIAAVGTQLRENWRTFRYEGLAALAAQHEWGAASTGAGVQGGHGGASAAFVREHDTGLYQLTLYDTSYAGGGSQSRSGTEGGGLVPAGCAVAPRSCELLRRILRLGGYGDGDEPRGSEPATVNGRVKFSLLRPGVHVFAHTGTTNARLRLHLGLHVPAQSSCATNADHAASTRPYDPTHGAASARFRMRLAAGDWGMAYASESVSDDNASSRNLTWREGEFFVFDDSFEHELWSDPQPPSPPPQAGRTGEAEGPEDVEQGRLILIVDLAHPDAQRNGER